MIAMRRALLIARQTGFSQGGLQGTSCHSCTRHLLRAFHLTQYSFCENWGSSRVGHMTWTPATGLRRGFLLNSYGSDWFGSGRAWRFLTLSRIASGRPLLDPTRPDPTRPDLTRPGARCVTRPVNSPGENISTSFPGCFQVFLSPNARCSPPKWVVFVAWRTLPSAIDQSVSQSPTCPEQGGKKPRSRLSHDIVAGEHTVVMRTQYRVVNMGGYMFFWGPSWRFFLL